MTDKQFEEFLRNTAQEYNRPPEVTPRDEIWAQIDESRSDSWQRSQWREKTPWWHMGRGVAATIALWFFPLTAVGAGAALAINHWTSDDGPELSTFVIEHDHQEHQQHQEHAECGDMDTKVAALNALLQMDSDQAVPILVDVLDRRDECSVELRRRAVFLVSQHETDETVDLLFDAARTDPDFEVREQAVFWLGQASGDEAVDALETLLQEAEDVELEKKAVFSLSQHGSSRAMQILRDIALDSRAHQETREQAIFWLGEEGNSEEIEYLMQLYRRLDNTELREKVIFAVSLNGNEAGGRWLLGLARDENETVELRKNALFWAGEEGDIEASDLKAIYDDSEDVEIKEQVIFVLSQLDDSHSVSELISIVRHERNKELRDRAIFWLGESDDPRAAEFLAELINRPNG